MRAEDSLGWGVAGWEGKKSKRNAMVVGDKEKVKEIVNMQERKEEEERNKWKRWRVEWIKKKKKKKKLDGKSRKGMMDKIKLREGIEMLILFARREKFVFWDL